MRNWGDLIGGLVLVLVGVGITVESIRLQLGTLTAPKAGFFPFISGLLLIVLSVILMVHRWVKPEKEAWAFGEVRRPAIFIAGSIIYVALLDPLGYVLATIFLVVVILWVLRIRSWRTLAVASVALSLGTYLLFDRVLGVELPTGLLGFLV